MFIIFNKYLMRPIFVVLHLWYFVEEIVMHEGHLVGV